MSVEEWPDEITEAALGLAWLSEYGSSPLLRLLPYYGAEAIWEAPAHDLGSWGMASSVVERFNQWRRGFKLKEAQKCLERSGLRFIPYGSPLFPPELADLVNPPAGLFLRGSLSQLERLLGAARITVVGTRRATPSGHRVTDMFVQAFTERDVAVVSGLALGIDGRAHRATLDQGGLTVAILGCGADRVYPSRHRSLYEEISRRGLLFSELPPGALPARWTFPHRNRLLAALGDAVLVVEAPKMSGTLQTVAAALELGREVFAVPGSVLADSYKGCNWLLYDGAAPAIDPNVTIEEFFLRTRIERKRRGEATGASANSLAPARLAVLPPECRSIFVELQGGPLLVDLIASRTNAQARDVMAALAQMEIAGLVTRLPGGWYARAP